jgi:hypothetical protein
MIRDWLSDIAAFIRYYPLAFMMAMAEREAEAESKRLGQKALRELEEAHRGQKDATR